MGIRITDNQNSGPGRTILLVEGALGQAEARLLEKFCSQILAENDKEIVFNLAEITFFDSQSASLPIGLRRRGVAIEGLDFFVSRMIEMAERGKE